MVNKTPTDNDKYFCIRLERSNERISIHEVKCLSVDEYHPIGIPNTHDYQILVEVEKTVGQAIYSLCVLPEPYKTYEFQNITYRIINDYNIDEFEYDSERKIVIYGWIYGIYATKSGNNYYDVITREMIPLGTNSIISEVKTVDNYSDMIEDLELIKKHKDAYVRRTKEIFSTLVQGAMNKKVAEQQYNQKYEDKKKAQKERGIQEKDCYQQLLEKFRIDSYPNREKVKRLISEIRNN